MLPLGVLWHWGHASVVRAVTGGVATTPERLVAQACRLAQSSQVSSIHCTQVGLASVEILISTSKLLECTVLPMEFYSHQPSAGLANALEFLHARDQLSIGCNSPPTATHSPGSERGSISAWSDPVRERIDSTAQGYCSCVPLCRKVVSGCHPWDNVACAT